MFPTAIIADQLEVEQKNHLRNQDPELHPRHTIPSVSPVLFKEMKRNGKKGVFGVELGILLDSKAKAWSQKEGAASREVIGARWVKPALRYKRIGVFEVLGAASRDVAMDADECLEKKGS